jgi:multicomponent Na+:H+ antiporter subunit A
VLHSTAAWLRHLDFLTPTKGYLAAFEGTLRLAAWQTRVLQHGRLRGYVLVVLTVVLALVGGSVYRHPPSMPALVSSYPHEWAAAAIVLLGAAATVAARSRLAAVVALGLVGFGVAALYALFGAPDLAMTQFCVETLSAILFILVLARLPRFSRLSGRLVRLRDGVLATAAGVLVTLLAISVRGREPASTVASFFAAESLSQGHGRNVVNVILVDFRSLDTLGEITVLGVAALGVYGLVRSSRKGASSA